MIQGVKDMQDIIKKIIEIDRMAQKMSDESINLKKEAEIAVKNDTKMLREKYIENARKRIQVNTETEEKFLQETLDDIGAKSGVTETKIRDIFAQNKDKWVDEIYNRVLGR